MVDFEEREAEAERLANETVVDEDGFTVVKAKGATYGNGATVKSFAGPKVATGAFSMHKQNQGVHKKKKKLPEEKLDFYRFQWRQKKQKEITDFREKKKKDMQTIEAMRKSKTFKKIGSKSWRN